MKYSHTVNLIILSLLSVSYTVNTTAGNGSSSTTDISEVTSDQNSQCPLWTTTASNSACLCGSTHGLLVHCENKNKTVTLPYCYCMSRSELYNTTVIGFCIARCHVQSHNPARHGDSVQPGSHRYKILVNNTLNDTETNHALCSDLKMNRVGQMCGSCAEGYAPPVYSYSSKCVKCSNYRFNWLKYIAIAYLPLTVFYILVILFRISATSARVNGYITTCQLVTSPSLLRSIIITVFNNSSNTYSGMVPFKAVLTLYSICNLDFFRLVYTPFCIHPRLSTLQTLSLDYIVAVYPLLLVILTCIMVKLHDHYIVIVRLWRPFYKCFAFFRKEWDLKTSLVNAFASFILFSYVKILNTSLDLLTPLILYDNNGNTLKQRYLGVDGTVKYFGTQHKPYALLALVMCSFCNIFPLLLLSLYSCCCFHRCMNRFRLHSQVVHTFMEVFQGSFKTEPVDYRIFAAFYVLLRVVNVLLLLLFGGLLYLPLVAIVMVLAAIVLAIAKPYKSSRANYIDVILFLLLALASYFVPTHQNIQSNTPGNYYHHIFNVVTGFVLSFHVLYGIGIFVVAVQPKMFKTLWTFIYEKCMTLWNSTPPVPRLPDRLEHPDDPAYAPLITGAQETVNYVSINIKTFSLAGEGGKPTMRTLEAKYAISKMDPYEIEEYTYMCLWYDLLVESDE